MPAKPSQTAAATLSCTICRSKKLKCDRVRPQCGRCTKLGEGCEYPESRQNRIGTRRHARNLETRMCKCHGKLRWICFGMSYLDSALLLVSLLTLPPAQIEDVLVQGYNADTRAREFTDHSSAHTDESQMKSSHEGTTPDSLYSTSAASREHATDDDLPSTELMIKMYVYPFDAYPSIPCIPSELIVVVAERTSTFLDCTRPRRCCTKLATWSPCSLLQACSLR